MWLKSSLLLLFCCLCIINISSSHYLPKSRHHQQHRIPDHGLMDDSYGGPAGGQMEHGQQQYGKKVYDALDEDKEEGEWNVEAFKNLSDMLDQYYGKVGYGSFESKKKQPTKHASMDDPYVLSDDGYETQKHEKLDGANGYQLNADNGRYGNGGNAILAAKFVNPGLMFGPPSDNYGNQKEAHGRYKRYRNEYNSKDDDDGTLAAWGVAWILLCIVLPILICCCIIAGISSCIYCSIRK